MIQSFLVCTALVGVLAPACGRAESSFAFGAAGDFSSNPKTAGETFSRMASSGTSFFLALGDLSYSPKTSEQEWVESVKSAVGPAYPFELVAGNHEDDDGKDGFILNFAAGLPDRMEGSHGAYAAEYYFDYPAASPLVRVIMISPDLKVKGTWYQYKSGSLSYHWLSETIDGARRAGIPWVIVGMHKVCVSVTARHGCEIGTDLITLLMDKKVDLVLQGHEHSYERSKQLTCALSQAYEPACVVNDGSHGPYVKGAGTVIVIAGTGGQRLEDQRKSQVGAYFVSVMDGTTPGHGWGFVTYTVSKERIDAETKFSGSFQDKFSIVRSPD